MRLWVLGSGSRGNAVLIESGDTRILVDAGFGTRTLAMRLKVAGVHPATIQACIITHDHSDHVSGAAAAVRKWGWELFASHGTARCKSLAETETKRFAPGALLQLSGMQVQTVATPHDASDPVGLLVTDQATGVRAGICYDIGHASEQVRTLCTDVDLLLLESNHDTDMLWAGPYPKWLCKRISGGSGHLSNRAAGDLARDSVSAQTAHIVLAHLSEKNNSPSAARRAMTGALSRTAFRGTLTVAEQDSVVGPFGPGASAVPEQYALAL